MQKIGGLFFPDQEKHFQAFGDDVKDYQRPQREKALEYVTDWSCALDGGANVGIFSRHFAEKFDKVLAVDPLTENIACIKLNTPDNVVPIQAALGDKMGDTRLYTGGKSLGNAFINGHDGVLEPNVGAEKLALPQNIEHAKMITIDSLELETLGLLKLDIQGAEVIALKGGAETIARCRPVILIEEKPIGGADGPTALIEEGRELLQSYGMKLAERVGADSIYTF